MIVNKESVGNVFLALKTIFNNAFAAAPSSWQKVAMLVPSTTKTNDYAWLSNFPRMRKWMGEKTIKALSAFKYSLTNDDFEATVEVDRNDIDDDQIGIYRPQAEAAGESAKQLPDELVFELINMAFQTPCFDGQYFFDTDHPVVQKDGSIASVSNKGTAPLSIASQAAAQASLGAAEVTMMEFKDDEGRPLNIKPNILLVPPALKATANALMTNDRLEDGKSNPFKDTYEVLCEPRLTSKTAWFLLDTTKPIKPIIYQLRKAPGFVQQTDPESDGVYLGRKFKFGAEARAAVGFGFWQTGFGSTGTGI